MKLTAVRLLCLGALAAAFKPWYHSPRPRASLSRLNLNMKAWLGATAAKKSSVNTQPKGKAQVEGAE
jgi:hypothetical protein